MHFSSLVALALSQGLVGGTALPAKRSTVEPYAPFTTSCPSGSLIRPAKSLSSQEKAYIQGRSKKTSQALASWLKNAWKGSDVDVSDLPTLALSMSGGGPKAGLTDAGAVYGLDGRESNGSPVGGLLQSMNYISALSGGSLTLSGMMANNFAKISTLRTEYYNENYKNLFGLGLSHVSAIVADVGNKTAAGYPATLADTYGRVIAYNFVQGPPAGGNGLLWSNVTTQSSFQDFEAPYPIITITQANVAGDMCFPTASSAIWEVAPYEFGSWDKTVDAFYPTKYMGTIGNGASGKCTAGFDNIGFITGVSSNILVSENASCTTGNFSSSSLNALSSLVHSAFPADVLVNPYSIIPDPFYQSSEAGKIRSQHNLFGTDGGDSGQGIPIFPWLQPERNVDVIFVVDAESDSPHNITDGSSVYATYKAAKMNGLSKMPVVPTVAEFEAENLSAGPHFYGCHDKKVTTMVFFPNTGLGSIESENFFWTTQEYDTTFNGGVNMVEQRKESDWASCLACGIMHKTDAKLPASCTGCLEKYCWEPTSQKSSKVCVGSSVGSYSGVLGEVPCS